MLGGGGTTTAGSRRRIVGPPPGSQTDHGGRVAVGGPERPIERIRNPLPVVDPSDNEVGSPTHLGLFEKLASSNTVTT